MLIFKTQFLRQRILAIGDKIIEEQAAGEDIQLLLEDTNFNGSNVIDNIAYLDITELLMNPVMNEIVSIYWDGPYERVSFIENCTNYRILKNVFRSMNEQLTGFEASDDVVQNPNKIVSSSLGIRSVGDIKKSIKKARKKTQSVLFGMKKKDKEKSFGHMFMYRVWRDSLFVN